MATATSQKQKSDSGSGFGQKIRYGAYTIFAVLALLLAFSFSNIKGQATLGTAYAAHMGCSCRYIEGRPLGACYKDFEAGMGMISLADDADHKRVTASIPLLASATAELRGDFGCLQLNSAEIDAID